MKPVAIAKPEWKTKAPTYRGNRQKNPDIRAFGESSLAETRQDLDMAGQRFNGIDGLRGVCALTVLLFHCNDLFRTGPIVPHGFLSVDVFFMMSGFVIALTYEDRLRAGGGLRPFLFARGLRLLPIYWLGAALGVAIFVLMAASGYYPSGYSWPIIWIVVPVTTMLMIPAFGAPGTGAYPAMRNVAWSLFVEWSVNIAYAAGLFRWKTSTLAALVAAGWLAMAVAGYFTGRGWCVGMGRDDIFTLGVLRGAPSFFAGIVIYRLYARGLFDRLPMVSTELLLTSWLCVAVFPTRTATPTFDWIAVTLYCPLLVALLIRSNDRAPAFCKPLGRISYPLYTVHPGILLLAAGTPVFGLDHGPNFVRALGVVFICIAAAWLVERLASGLPRLHALRPGLPSGRA